jgi:hypothetical protein
MGSLWPVRDAIRSWALPTPLYTCSSRVDTSDLPLRPNTSFRSQNFVPVGISGTIEPVAVKTDMAPAYSSHLSSGFAP